MPALIPLTLLATTLALVAAGAQGQDLDEQLPARSGGRLEVDIDLGIGLRSDPGSLQVSTHSRDEVRVVTESSGWGSWSVVFDLSGEQGDARLLGRVEGATSWMFGGPRVVVRIWVPEHYDVDLRTTAGPVRIENLTGAVRARVEDGSIELRDTRGPAKLRATTGSVEVADIEGDLDAKTSEGRIEAARVAGGVRARTTYGAIELREIDGDVNARAVEGDIELLDVGGRVVAHAAVGEVRASFLGDPSGALETERGMLEVRFPGAAHADLDARTQTGVLELDAGVAVNGELGPKRAIGAINGGGPPLWLRAGDGGIRVSRR